LIAVPERDPQDQAAQIASSPERLRELVHAIGRTTQSVWAAAARAVGLGSTDLSALSHLSSAGAMTGAELGQILGLSSSSITELADRLEDAGLLNRSRSKNDRRHTLLKATAKGRRTARKALAPIDARLDHIAGAQHPTQLQRSVELLLDISAALSTPAP
jgi:DNA-binding MarR family transcriptional regulator